MQAVAFGKPTATFWSHAFKQQNQVRADNRDVNSKAVCEVHQSLRELQIPDSEIDTGFSVIDYEHNRETKGGRNDGVQCEEAIEYAFEKGFVEKEPKVRRSIERMLGYSLPWEFAGEVCPDDAVSGTNLTTKIEAAITRLKTDLQKLQAAGKLKEKGEYEEAAAAALYLFAYAPTSKEEMEIVENDLKDEIIDLEKLGLRDFLQDIKEQGGLGLIFMHKKEKKDSELDALQALLQNKGECTEKSKILYALFKQTGLSPFFVEVELSEIDPKNRSSGQAHVCVGLNIGGKVRLFDAAQHNANASYKNYHRLTLRHYLIFDLNNRAWDLIEKDKAREALKVYQRALKFGKDSTAYFVHLGQGELYIKWGQYKEAQTVLLQSLAIYPRHPETLYSLGYVSIRLNQVNDGLDYLLKSLEADIGNQKQWSDVGQHLTELTTHRLGAQKIRLALHRFKNRLADQIAKKRILKEQVEAGLIYFSDILKSSLKPEVAEIMRILGMKMPKVKPVDKKK